MMRKNGLVVLLFVSSLGLAFVANSADEPFLELFKTPISESVSTKNWLDYDGNLMDFRDKLANPSTTYNFHAGLSQNWLTIHIELKVTDNVYMGVLAEKSSGSWITTEGYDFTKLVITTYLINNMNPYIGEVPPVWEAYRLIGAYVSDYPADLTLSSNDFAEDSCLPVTVPYSAPVDVYEVGFHPLCGGVVATQTASASTTTTTTELGGGAGVGETQTLNLQPFAIVAALLLVAYRKRLR
jgi:hypothetical protein